MRLDRVNTLWFDARRLDQVPEVVLRVAVLILALLNFTRLAALNLRAA